MRKGKTLTYGTLTPRVKRLKPLANTNKARLIDNQLGGVQFFADMVMGFLAVAVIVAVTLCVYKRIYAPSVIVITKTVSGPCWGDV